MAYKFNPLVFSGIDSIGAGGSQTPWTSDIDGGGYNLSNVGSITTGSLTDSGLTATRVTFAGTGGLLSDDSALTFVTDYVTNNTVTLQIGNNISNTNSLISFWDGEGYEKAYISFNDYSIPPQLKIFTSYLEYLSLGTNNTARLVISDGGNIAMQGLETNYPLSLSYLAANTTVTPALFIDNPATGTQTVLGLGINTTLKGYLRADSSDNVALVSQAATGDLYLRTNGVGGETSIAYLKGSDLSSTFYGTVNATASTSLIIGPGEGGIPTEITIRGSAAAGADVAGANLNIKASNGTGTGGSGKISLWSGPGVIASPTYSTSSKGSNSSGTSLTVSHQSNTGAAGLLIVSICTAGTVTGVTYNGVAMTYYGSRVGNPGSQYWYMPAPPFGTFDIVVSTSGSAGKGLVAIGLDNAAQSSPIRGYSSYYNAGGLATSMQSTTTSVSGDLIVSALAGQNALTSITATGTGQTLRESETGTSYVQQYVSTQPSTGVSMVNSWTWSNSIGWEGQYDISIKPAENTVADTLYSRVTLDNQGYVGIGTQSPAQMLDIYSTAPSFQMTDSTSSAKSLRLVVDANVANFYEAAGAAGDILSLDLANKRIGAGTNAPATILEARDGLTTVGAVLTLGTKEPTVVVNDVLGRINFYAPLEADGGDSILVGASILALAEDTFSATVNKTSLVFQTGASEAATTKMTLLSGGNLGIGVTAPTAVLHLKAGTVTASTAPLKFTSGTLLGTPEAGAVEFLTDDFYGTITTGTARKGFVLTDGSNLTSGRVPYASTNGRLIDASTFAFDGSNLGVGVAANSLYRTYVKKNLGTIAANQNISLLAEVLSGNGNNDGSNCITGALLAATKWGTGDLTGVYGVRGATFQVGVSAASTGNVKSMCALMINVYNQATITTGSQVTTADGIIIMTPPSNTGNIATMSGLRIQSQAGTGIATSYGIYQLGAGDINSFAGNVRIDSDTTKFYCGAGQDMTLWYDGTDGQLKTSDVAASDLVLTCGSQKTLKLANTVYNDANVSGLILRTGGTAPGIVEWLDNDGDATGIYTVGFAVNEQGSGSIEIPHDYAEGTDLTFHIHFGCNDAPSGTDYVEWQLIYNVQRDGTTFVDATSIDSNDITLDTQYKTLRADFTAITGTTFKIGDQFNFTIKRIAAAGDAYAGELLLQTCGFHYQCDTLGSRQIGTK